MLLVFIFKILRLIHTVFRAIKISAVTTYFCDGTDTFVNLTIISRGRVNPLVTNGLSHRYHLDESTFILGAWEVIFIFASFFDEN